MDLSKFRHETKVRVRYAETDKMGIVYHANYLVWFEIGRTEYCRSRGIEYRSIEDSENLYLVVAESYCRYKSPAYYDDVLIISTFINELKRRSLRFGYQIMRESDGIILAEGETTHLFTGKDSRVRALPDDFVKTITTEKLEPENEPAQTDSSFPAHAPS